MDQLSLPPADLSQFALGPAGHGLALDLVAKIKPVDRLLQDYGLTANELTALLTNPLFAQRVRECNAAWNSPANAAERIKAKAAVQLEDAQVQLTAMAYDEKGGAGVKLQAMAMMARLAGMDQSKGGVVTGNHEAGPRFQIQFVFNAAADKGLTIEGRALPEEPSQDAA